MGDELTDIVFSGPRYRSGSFSRDSYLSVSEVESNELRNFPIVNDSVSIASYNSTILLVKEPIRKHASIKGCVRQFDFASQFLLEDVFFAPDSLGRTICLSSKLGRHEKLDPGGLSQRRKLQLCAEKRVRKSRDHDINA